MVTMTGTALWTALFLLTAHTAYGQNETTYDYDSNEFNDGSCSYKKLNCATGSLCVQNPGHTRFKCFCPDGYAGDGYLEEFKTGATGCELVGGPVLCTSSNDCNEYADCNPIDNLRSQCVCRDGFTGSGAIDNGCTDIAECEGNPCAENANCYEEPGGFTCKCDSARNYEGDGYVKCIWICYSHQDCAPHGRCTSNRTCECDTGFTGDGRSCTDIDECTNGDSDCPDKSTCNNTPGSFECVCANGYEYKDKTCVPYYQTCDAIYRANRNRLSNGRYTIDLDFEGPLPAIEVDCIVKDGVAITEIAPTESFPQTVPKTGGDKPVKYPIDPTPLINNSDFCSQRVWLQCTDKFTGGMIRWEDRQGRKRKGWGSNKDGVCGCGQFRKCPNGCNCGFGAEGEDEGLIVDKDQLPVSKVTFPALNTANAGNYIVGPLRCGPKPFDIPRDCHEARFKNKVEKNQPLVIDIDGDGPSRPFLVYCNQEAYPHVGIIEIPPDQLVISRTPAEGSSVEYLVPGPDVNNAINGSVFCSQRVEYECSSDTMTAAGVKVETRSGVLNYFPGGSNDQPGSCGCGLTNSCEDKRFKCNCNIGDGKARKDQGLIINRSRLPVLKVKSTSSDNFYKIGPLQCSRFQFGIEPNCEKLRQSDVTETYSYRIDPDGPGNLEPFTAQCEMDANKGVTVINNENGGALNLASGKSFSIDYPNASPAQLTALKDRSTSCVQSVTFTGCSGASVSIDGMTYNSGKPLSDVLRGPCNGKSCKCDSPIKAVAKDKLPIYEITGGSARVTIGPLMCSEIFPDCQSYAWFIGKQGVLGENKIAKDVLTIDPDGAGDGEPFVVKCNFKETFIQKPTTIDPSQMKVRPGRPNPGVVCWNMSYTDQAGSGIGAPQMAALLDKGKNCAQTFKLSCENAVGTGMVSYRTCGGTKITGFVSGDVEASCACGASGTCAGGPDKGCNCDSSGVVRTLDENLIITQTMLPICEVCLELEDTAGAGAGQPESRFIRFDVGELRCGRKQGRRGNCQMYRQEDEFAALEEEVFKDMWFDITGKSILVGCRFKPDPGTGELVVRPADPVYEPGPGYTDGNITVVYKSFTISDIREAMAGANYCTQDILFFCAAQIPQLTGNFGLFSDGNRLEASDYSMRSLKPSELTKLCSDPRYAAQCAKCPNPKRLVITNKNKLPLTNILLPKDSKATVVIDDTACSYVETDCDAILKKDLVEGNLQKDGYYLIDPDQAGPLTPFRVKCDFTENQGITQVPSDPTLVEGQVGEGGNDAATDFNFQNTYPTATPEQINSLVQNSAFCWQGVKYECTETPLTSQAQLTAFNNQVLTSFGTGDNSAALGCACGVLGTCKTEDVSCNCDSKGSMVDQGFLTDKNVLPVTGFKGKVKANGRGKIKVTDVRCGPSPVDIPRDCAEAYEWGEKNGINYRVQGEFLVNPDPGTVRPFLAFCDYSDPENPKTRIRPRPTKQKPVGDTDPEVEYQGPSDDQLKALAKISVYCYQPVKINCYGAKFLKGGVKFRGADGVDRSFWSSGDGDQPTCTCGTENLCGGTVSRKIQEATDCNCDIGDDVWRSDAAILRVKGRGPLRKLLTSGVFSASQGRLNLTVGDLVCSKKPLSFNECDNGFNDCAPQAKCVDQTSGYRCECPDGWQGKISKSGSNPDPPMANGRQCIDDDECSRPNRCRYNSDCVNTLGSYKCTCKQGFRNIDDFNCVDIDECTENSHNCDSNARCVNTNGAYRCRCKKGFRGTGRKGKCHPVGQCACFGDPHCLSFDGRWNHYQGVCTYTMAENNCGGATVAGIPKFKVKTNNWDRSYKGDGLYSWIKETTVEVYGKTILIGQGRKIMVNGREKTAYRMLSEDKTTVLLQISVIGFKVQLWTNFGLEVLADGVDEVTVITPANMQNTTCGLCGNYNGNPADDWVVGPKCPPKEGQVTTRETLFGNSWSVESDESCAVDCDPPPRNKTCNVPELQAKQVCDRLFNADSPFFKAGCMAQMPSNDLTAFRFSCEFDLCHTADLRTAQCEVAEALASYCTDLLADGFEWRSADLCAETDKCKDNEEYLVCGPESEPTCMTPGPVVIENCMESCFCKEGFVRQGEECIKAEECGCEYANSFLKIGDEILVDDCSKKVTCAEHDTLKELDNQCADTEACKTDDTGAMSCQLTTTTQAPTTTTPAPTTPAPTTPAPTTPAPTTPAPTTPAPTTPAPTPPAPTPPAPTTPAPTTPAPTTPAPTTPAPTTPAPTTPAPTTPAPTTLAPTTPAPTPPAPTTPAPTPPAPTPPAPTTPAPTTPAPTTPAPTPPAPTPSAPTTPAPTTAVAPGPGPTDVAAPPVAPTTPGADLCAGVSCTKPNTECQAGQCVCKMGYTADCEVCKDIDECETGDNTCIHLGQKCVNTEGSFQCQCQDGFLKKDDFCHDINECEDAKTNCGEHAECKNLLGSYQCICCQGYSKNGEQCQRDESLDAVYGAPGEECCACSGGQCRNPEPVCGSDGKTYGNFAAMVVQGCRNNRTIEVDHKGSCEDSCSEVKCDKPFQKCSQTGPGGSAKCSCPDCGGAATPDNSNPVCGSNKKIYSSACMFRLVMCEIDRSDITLEDSMEPCEEGKDEPVTKWSDWSECDVKCGKGRTRRNRQRLAQTDLPLTQETSCYKLCDDGPCRPGTCNNPGQVCVVDGATGKGRCECPDCTGRPEAPVCGLVGNVVRSFDNECKLRRGACELAKNFQLLENRACEEKPQNCSVTRNFAKLRDAEGCVSAGDQDVGFCYGGCGDVPGKCCRPDTTTSPQRSANITYTCPDGSTRTKQERVITACSCVAEPEQ